MNSLKEQGIRYAVNTKDATAIYEHLLACDQTFVDSIIARTPLKEYASKLFAAAMRFEALDNDRLIGLVACYLNNFETKEGFITNVSVVNGYKGKGIAYHLMENTIRYASEHGFIKINLEVEKNNKAALTLYAKCGFNETIEKNGFVKMEKKI